MAWMSNKKILGRINLMGNVSIKVVVNGNQRKIWVLPKFWVKLDSFTHVIQIDFKTDYNKRWRISNYHYLFIKMSTQQEDTALISNYVPNNSSVQFSHSVVYNSLQPHESQNARTPCPSPTPGVHSDSRLSSQWCHPSISSSVVPFSSCPQSLPASESFPMSQLFASGGQSTAV